MPKTLLVTGGTGLIGAEVLLALAQLGHRATALVRARDDAEAHRRLSARLQKSARYAPEFMSSIHAVAGDTTAPHFGLDSRRDLASGHEILIETKS